MKKILVLFAAFALLICMPACFADESGRWYEVNDDASEITVCLDANATTGFSWSFSITDETILEPVADGYVEDECEEILDGTGGEYIAAFKAAGLESGSVKAGPVSVVFTYARGSNKTIGTAILDLYVSGDGRISVENALNDSIDDSGCTLNADGTVMTIRFNCLAADGCAWNWTIDDTDILDEITGSTFPNTEGLTSGMAASFFAANTPFKDEKPIQAGETFVTVTFGGIGEGEVPLFNCVYKVTVADDGTLTVE